MLDLETLIGQRIAGRYRIEQRLGTGGSGAVFQAYDEQAGRRCAIKLLDNSVRESEALARRFLQEARIIGAIRDPRVVRLHDVITLDDGRPGLVLELVEGQSLSARLSAGPMSLSEVIDVMYELLTALAACHAVGVVHGDVKPENVMIITKRQVSEPRVKLVDFGFARAASVQMSDPDALTGSPAYMAPEQWFSDPSDAQTDQYAAALVAYTMLLGSSLMDSAGLAVEMCAQHLHRPRPDTIISVAGEPVPPSLVQALARASAPERSDRFPDVLALRALLRDADPRFSDHGAEATVPAPERPIPSIPPPQIEDSLINWLADESDNDDTALEPEDADDTALS